MSRETEPTEGDAARVPGERREHRSVVEPSPQAAASFVQDALAVEQYVTVVGTCRVTDSSRADSDLNPGRRHVVVKPDGTTLVHDASGHQPVTCQAAAVDVDVDESGRTTEVVVAASVSNRDDRLVVRFSNVLQVGAFAVEVDETPNTDGTEADLKRHVLENPAVVERGLQPLATERETPAGPVDVYAEDRDGNPVVLELKRARVGPDAVGQLVRYVDALARDIHADADPRGVLVAPSVTDSARQLLAEEGLGFASVAPPTG